MTGDTTEVGFGLEEFYRLDREAKERERLFKLKVRLEGITGLNVLEIMDVLRSELQSLVSQAVADALRVATANPFGDSP